MENYKLKIEVTNTSGETLTYCFEGKDVKETHDNVIMFCCEHLGEFKYTKIDEIIEVFNRGDGTLFTTQPTNQKYIEDNLDEFFKEVDNALIDLVTKYRTKLQEKEFN